MSEEIRTDGLSTTLEFAFHSDETVTVFGGGFGDEGMSFRLDSQRDEFIKAADWVTQLSLAYTWGFMDRFSGIANIVPTSDLDALAGAYLDFLSKHAKENQEDIYLTV